MRVAASERLSISQVEIDVTVACASEDLTVSEWWSVIADTAGSDTQWPHKFMPFQSLQKRL